MELQFADQPDTWNTFVRAHAPRSGAFLQSWAWGDFQTAAGRLVVAEKVLREGSHIVAESMIPRLFSPVTMQNQPHGDWFSEGKNYINSSNLYTSYIIDYFDTESVDNQTIVFIHTGGIQGTKSLQLKIDN